MARTESSNRGLQNLHLQLHLERHPSPVKIQRLTHSPIG
jgi:hypothetical protein